jgi:hypothetical protein
MGTALLLPDLDNPEYGSLDITAGCDVYLRQVAEQLLALEVIGRI